MKANRAGTMLIVIGLVILSLVLAYSFLFWWAEKYPRNLEVWINWAGRLPRWLDSIFGLRGHMSTATRLIITGTSVVVLMIVLSSRIVVALGYSLFMRSFGPVIRTAIFYAVAALLAKATLVIMAAVYPDTFRVFFDRAGDIMENVRDRVDTKDSMTLALKTLLDAKALMVVVLTLIWRAMLNLFARIAGINDSEVVDEVPSVAQAAPTPPVAQASTRDAAGPPRAEVAPAPPFRVEPIPPFTAAPRDTPPKQGVTGLTLRERLERAAEEEAKRQAAKGKK